MDMPQNSGFDPPPPPIQGVIRMGSRGNFLTHPFLCMLISTIHHGRNKEIVSLFEEPKASDVV